METWSVEDKTGTGAKPLTRPTQLFIAPDPYISVPNSAVASWALQEAESVEALGRKCEQDEIIALQRKSQGIAPDPVHGFLGPEGVQVMFWRDYTSLHEVALAKLHDSLAFRLGPVTTASEEAEYKELLDHTAQANSNPKQWAWVVCHTVQDYAQNLREKAAMLTLLTTANLQTLYQSFHATYPRRSRPR